MRSSFEFSNLLGVPFSGGNVVFSKDGNRLFCPVGCRVSVHDLASGSTSTLPFETIDSIVLLCLSPCNSVIIAIDAKGRSIIYNLYLRIILSFFNFKQPVSCISFSPEGKIFAVGLGTKIQLWELSSTKRREFAPLHLINSFYAHRDNITFVSWSNDGRCLLSGSSDMTSKVHFLLDSIPQSQSPPSVSLVGHKHGVVGGYFYDESKIITIGSDCNAYLWQLDISKKVLENIGLREVLKLSEEEEIVSHVTSTAFSGDLILAGFQNGAFALFRISDDELKNIHTLSVSKSSVTSVSMSSDCEWLAMACNDDAENRSLIVWEWKTETFVFKQQGHSLQSCLLSSLDISADALLMATGGKDGKVKVWNAATGACMATFSDHRAEVGSVYFCKQKKILTSCSSDGSIRLYDLNRFKQFRLLTSPSPQQFSTTISDPSGEVVIAGTHDSWDVFVWSIQTSQILDVLSGHQGPVQCLAFDPVHSILASASWDRTVRTWNIFSRDKQIQSIELDSEVMSICFHPSGQELAATTLKGSVFIIDTEEGVIKSTIEARNDVWVKPSETRTNLAANSSILFTSCSYSSDGKTLLVSGRCPFVLLYDIQSKVVLQRFPLSTIEGKLRAKKENDSITNDLQSEIVCMQSKMAFSGKLWAGVTNEGLIVYTSESILSSQPFDLDTDCTPESVEKALVAGDYVRALVSSIRLSNHSLFIKVWLSIPASYVDICVRAIPPKYAAKILIQISKSAIKNVWTEYERSIDWCNAIFKVHSRYFHIDPSLMAELTPVFRVLTNLATEHVEGFISLADENRLLLKSIMQQKL